MLKRFLSKTLNQFILPIPAGMPTESPYSSPLRTVSPHPDSSPPGRAPLRAGGHRAASMA